MTRAVTIFVCGVGGVGKTHLISSALRQLPDALAWRASEIIGEARNTSDPEYLRQLPTDQMLQSQELLVKGFKAREAHRDGRLVLLDAHTVIDAPAGFFEVPLEVISQLSPQALVHVEDSVERILERRAQDTQRKRPARTADELATYQARSLSLSGGFARKLGIPLHRIISGDERGLRRVISSVTAGRASG